MNTFKGKYECKMDSKGRIIIPSKFREELTKNNNSFVITRSLDNAIDIFPYEAWEKYDEKISRLSDFNPKQRAVKRFLTHDATSVECDAQGRINIPKTLIEHANLKKNILVAGYGDRIQIWDKETYDEILLKDLEIMNDLELDIL
ncbi:division/cell wall cluster transcriptional repressor MraZ [Oceanivirga miroungae]|uniref:Transcriptional regulator MraZ n=1 Tax=Oceanivirga miroungae TaxID=1130046 RepID=A0A6I8MD53_9FUSO|nr:division/cell wall cluster transcriptional repressor MraZ [Oceanivirga miroungae]VWL85432.1 Transcriptional regulator MraZ [Oceanivirga miroungae]